LRGLDALPPLVIDPVMIATSGDSLLKDDALAVYTGELLPLATLITPNLDEAAALSGRQIRKISDLEEIALELAAKFRTHVLAKGGHLQGELATDILAGPDGSLQAFSAPFVPGVNTHGTGCTYSAAIAANLAKGDDLTTSTSNAKRFVSAAIRDYFRWRETDALNHFQQN
jgi:hydroxymethylpyrimidine/phosphomethylpyrimidine kinase